MNATSKPLLQIKDLKLFYKTQKGIARAVDGISLEMAENEALVILGESGCGKSSLAKSILRLLPENTKEYSGIVNFLGRDIMSLSEEQFRSKIRWQGISMVMQAAMNSLNPVIKVGEQVAEPLLVHLGWSKEKAAKRAAQIFEQVGISTDFLNRYPFELSGGMKQRVVLAMALVTGPSLVILDEPTSALDVLTQASIMNVLKKIKKEEKTSFILITHDVATSSEIADKVALMYAGQIVEIASARSFFHEPAHPYSKLLLASVPRLRQTQAPDYILGTPPNLLNLPEGCRFASRCPDRFDLCDKAPALFSKEKNRQIRCWKFCEDCP